MKSIITHILTLARAAIVLVVLAGLSLRSDAQIGPGSGPGIAPTINNSAKITTGLTYQTVLPLGQYKSIIIESNNTNAQSDTCYVEGSGKIPAGNTTSTNVTTPNGTMTSAQASATLGYNGSYTRTWPLIPPGPFVVTCTTTGDSVYIEVQ